MTINELILEVNGLSNATKMPKYIEALDISDSQVLQGTKWGTVLYSWGICRKEGQFIYFETDNERGYVSNKRVFQDENSATEYALSTLKIINDALNESTPSDIAIRYIVNSYNYSQTRAKKMVEQIAGYSDIFEEFLNYIRIGKFRKKDRTQTQIEGFTAERLCKEYDLSPLGAYNFLVYLREEPQNALADLKAGLPRK